MFDNFLMVCQSSRLRRQRSRLLSYAVMSRTLSFDATVDNNLGPGKAANYTDIDTGLPPATDPTVGDDVTINAQPTSGTLNIGSSGVITVNDGIQMVGQCTMTANTVQLGTGTSILGTDDTHRFTINGTLNQGSGGNLTYVNVNGTLNTVAATVVDNVTATTINQLNDDDNYLGTIVATRLNTRTIYNFTDGGNGPTATGGSNLYDEVYIDPSLGGPSTLPFSVNRVYDFDLHVVAGTLTLTGGGPVESIEFTGGLYIPGGAALRIQVSGTGAPNSGTVLKYGSLHATGGTINVDVTGSSADVYIGESLDVSCEMQATVGVTQLGALTVSIASGGSTTENGVISGRSYQFLGGSATFQILMESSNTSVVADAITVTGDNFYFDPTLLTMASGGAISITATNSGMSTMGHTQINSADNITLSGYSIGGSRVTAGSLACAALSLNDATVNKLNIDAASLTVNNACFIQNGTLTTQANVTINGSLTLTATGSSSILGNMAIAGGSLITVTSGTLTVTGSTTYTAGGKISKGNGTTITLSGPVIVTSAFGYGLGTLNYTTTSVSIDGKSMADCQAANIIPTKTIFGVAGSASGGGGGGSVGGGFIATQSALSI